MTHALEGSWHRKNTGWFRFIWTLEWVRVRILKAHFILIYNPHVYHVILITTSFWHSFAAVYLCDFTPMPQSSLFSHTHNKNPQHIQDFQPVLVFLRRPPCHFFHGGSEGTKGPGEGMMGAGIFYGSIRAAPGNTWKMAWFLSMKDPRNPLRAVRDI